MQEFQYQICWLREKFPWMGNYSGYDVLCDYIQEISCCNHISVYRPSKQALPGVINRVVEKAIRSFRKSKSYDANGLVTEMSAVLRSIGKSIDVTHVLYVERTLGLLPHITPKIRGKLIGTVHQPPILWQNGRHHIDLLKDLSALIVLSKVSFDYFEQYLPGRVHYVPHGIDTVFFHPDWKRNGNQKGQEPPRCVFSGTWLRDIEVLTNVIIEVLRRNRSYRFDLLIPKEQRKDPYFSKLDGYDQICWHENLSNSQLRELYQNASLLLLPIKECTANNALLEAMACGLPVVSNNVGGLRDYTREDFAKLLPVGDVDGMVEAVLSLTSDLESCLLKGLQARSFVEENFNWPKIAGNTVTVYRKALHE